MIIPVDNITYEVMKTYLEGYFDGIGVVYNKNISLEISRWFQDKINIKSSNYWTNQIQFHYSNKTDKELIEILLDTTEEYFKETLSFNCDA